MEKRTLFSLSFWRDRTHLLLLLYGISSLLFFFLASFFLRGREASDIPLSLGLAQALALFLPLLFALHMQEGETFFQTRDRLSFSFVLRAISVLLSACAFFLGYKALLSLLEIPFAYTVLRVPAPEISPLSVVSFVVLPAFLEEFFCRGLVYSHLREYGIVSCMTVTTLLSAFLYLPSPWLLPLLLVFGILMGLLRLISRSFFPTFLMMAAVKLFCFLDARGLFALWHLEGQNMLLFCLGAFFLFLLFIALALSSFGRLVKQNRTETAQSPKKLWSSLMLWGVFLLCGLLCVLMGV